MLIILLCVTILNQTTFGLSPAEFQRMHTQLDDQLTENYEAVNTKQRSTAIRLPGDTIAKSSNVIQSNTPSGFDKGSSISIIREISDSQPSLVKLVSEYKQTLAAQKENTKKWGPVVMLEPPQKTSGHRGHRKKEFHKAQEMEFPKFIKTIINTQMGINQSGSTGKVEKQSHLTPKRKVFINRTRYKRFALGDRSLNKECEITDGLRGYCRTTYSCFLINGRSFRNNNCAQGFCCLRILNSCNASTQQNLTLWLSPNLTPWNNNALIKNTDEVCRIKVYKKTKYICQVQLKFEKLEIAQPRNGSCITERLIILGNKINSPVPHLCGNLTGTHVNIDSSSRNIPLVLKVLRSKNYTGGQWMIQIIQIECDNPALGPINCLQYYTGSQGIIHSFNYDSNLRTQYFNNLNYAICFRREQGFCSIQYRVTNDSTFNLVNINSGTFSYTPGTAGTGSIECPQDYIVISGTKLCGDRLNDGSNPNMSLNTNIEDNFMGPLVLHFISNSHNVGTGFQLSYQQYPC